MGEKPMKKKKIKFTPAMDETLLKTYLKVGANWKEIERVMRSCHLEEIVDRSPEDASKVE